jgi:hypothetical protein
VAAANRGLPISAISRQGYRETARLEKPRNVRCMTKSVFELNKKVLMKRLKLLFVALLSFHYVNAQNWMPISQNNIYNYELANDSTFTSLWVDSVAQDNLDTIWCLNKVYKQSSNKSCLYVNQPSFLLSRFTMKNNLMNFYNSNTNTSYKLILNDTSSFVFDSINNIMAHCVLNNDSNLWGTTNDSINMFLLSNSDTVIISKNHGILKFPIFQNHLHYLLTGIQNSMGTQIPMFNDFFNFNTDDVFEYHCTSNSNTWYSFWTRHSIRKFTISDKIVNGDSLIYICSQKERSYTDGSTDTTYSAKIDTIIYINFPNSFINKYPCDTVQFLYYVNPVNQFYDATFKCISKYFGGYGGMPYGNNGSDTMCYTQFPFGCNELPYLEDVEDIGCCTYDHQTYSFRYGEGLGLLDKVYSGWNGGYNSCGYHLVLAAAKTQDINYGTFTNDSLFSSDTTVTGNSEILIYPNPVENYFILESKQPLKTSTLAIYNTNGQEILKQQITSIKTLIDMSSMSSGVYYVKLITDKIFDVKKIIKE